MDFTETPQLKMIREAMRDIGRRFPPHHLHESWMDYLYWDVVLDA